MKIATAMVIVIHAAGLIVLFQKLISTAAADNSAGRTIAQLYLEGHSVRGNGGLSNRNTSNSSPS
jgi:hypothetical protein